MSRVPKDCLWIVGLFALPLLLLRPLQDTPFIDDWCYAWSVQWLLRTGQLRLMEYSSSIHPAQTLWGALFCLPGGFSFSALRLSTWVLGASTLCGLYLLLLELNVARRQALIGVAVLAFNPIFFILSLSFMTDVPFLAPATWSALALVCALRRQSDRWLAASVLFACLACAVRLPGAVLPVATILALLLHGGKWGRSPARLALAALPLLWLVALLFWHQGHVYVSADISHLPNSPAKRIEQIKQHALPALPQMLLCDLLFAAGALGLCLLPLAVGAISRRWVLRAVPILLLLLCVYAAVRWLDGPNRPRSTYPPLVAGSTWAIEELGATSDLVPGHVRLSYPPWLVRGWQTGPLRYLPPLIQLVTLAAGAIILARSVWRPAAPGEPALYWLVIGQFLVSAILWLFYDRYILPLLPLMIALCLTPGPLTRPRLAVALVAALAAVSLVGTLDHLRYNRTLWALADQLRREGVPPSQIDGGYVLNAWFQYAHPDDAPRDGNGRVFVPSVTTNDHLPYCIAHSVLPGYQVLRTEQVPRWMGSDLTLYVLRADPPTRPATGPVPSANGG